MQITADGVSKGRYITRSPVLDFARMTACDVNFYEAPSFWGAQNDFASEGLLGSKVTSVKLLVFPRGDRPVGHSFLLQEKAKRLDTTRKKKLQPPRLGRWEVDGDPLVLLNIWTIVVV